MGWRRSCSFRWWIRRGARQVGDLPHQGTVRARSLVDGVGAEDGKLRREAAVVHFEHGLDHVRDVLGAKLAGVVLLIEARGRAEIRDYFAGVDEEDADVVFAELGAPAFGHAAQREFAG